MFFDFGFKSSSLLIFFIHGIVFTFLLLIKGFQYDNKSNFWLACFVFLSALYISPFMLGYANWYSQQNTRDLLFYLPLQQLFLLPVLLFFYVKSSLNKSWTFRKIDYIHFVPALVYAIYSLVVWITDKLILNEYYFYADNRDKDLDFWYQASGFILMAYYGYKSLLLYNQYRKNTVQTVSFADSILYAWIQRFLIALLFLLIIRLLFFVLNPEWGNFGRKYWYYLSFSILVYYISLSGYTNSLKMAVSFSDKLNYNQPLDSLLDLTSNNEPKEEIETKDQSHKMEYDEDLRIQIEKLMLEERVFINQDLTLFDIAKALNTHPKKVSNTINKGFKINFNDFVNRYRTEEVIKIVKSQEGNLKTLLGIAYDAGFNSKSTFNRSFKKITKLTPKEYFKNN